MAGLGAIWLSNEAQEGSAFKIQRRKERREMKGDEPNGLLHQHFLGRNSTRLPKTLPLGQVSQCFP